MNAADFNVYDLGRALEPAVPHHPNHVPLSHRLTKAHGDVVYEAGMSASNDVLMMGTHIGTHVDALGHISRDGRLYGGVEASEVQNRLTGQSGAYGIHTFDQLLWDAVLVDLPRHLGLEQLDPDHQITPDELEACLEATESTITQGAALFFRTGWGRQWPQVSYEHVAPGPGLDTVLRAYEQGARIFGSDTLAFEHQPAPDLPVHNALLVERGSHIIEGLTLESLSAGEVSNFLAVISPMKLVGGTAGPVRPVALVAREGGD